MFDLSELAAWDAALAALSNGVPAQASRKAPDPVRGEVRAGGCPFGHGKPQREGATA